MSAALADEAADREMTAVLLENREGDTLCVTDALRTAVALSAGDCEGRRDALGDDETVSNALEDVTADKERAAVALCARDADATSLFVREPAAEALDDIVAAADGVALGVETHAAAPAIQTRPGAHAGRAAWRVQAGPSGAAASQPPPGAEADVARVPPTTDTVAMPPAVSVAKAASA